MITLEQIVPKYMAAFGKKLRVRDLNEQAECPNCKEMPGKVYHEDGWDDEGTSQVGSIKDCSMCDGTGFVDDIPVTIEVL